MQITYLIHGISLLPLLLKQRKTCDCQNETTCQNTAIWKSRYTPRSPPLDKFSSLGSVWQEHEEAGEENEILFSFATLSVETLE